MRRYNCKLNNSRITSKEYPAVIHDTEKEIPAVLDRMRELMQDIQFAANVLYTDSLSNPAQFDTYADELDDYVRSIRVALNEAYYTTNEAWKLADALLTENGY